jgi:hypothetical protein
MITLDYRTAEIKTEVAEPAKASTSPGVYLLLVILGVAAGLAAVTLIG